MLNLRYWSVVFFLLGLVLVGGSCSSHLVIGQTGQIGAMAVTGIAAGSFLAAIPILIQRSPRRRRQWTFLTAALFFCTGTFLVWTQQRHLFLMLFLFWGSLLVAFNSIRVIISTPSTYAKASFSMALMLLLISSAEILSTHVADLPTSHLSREWLLNHTWQPNATRTHREFTFFNPDFPDAYTHHFNAQGWIEHYDVDREKPANTFRIFYVGDSFTEGTCPMEQSVPSRVESMLNEKYSRDSLHFEVINTGTSSYSPTIVYVLVRYVLMEYSPDLIVFNVDMTDVHDDFKYSRTVILDDSGNPRAVPPRGRTAIENPLTSWLYENLYTFNAALLLRTKDTGSHTGLETGSLSIVDKYHYFSWCRYEWDSATLEDVNRTRSMLSKLCLLCREKGIPLLLTGVPHYDQYRSSEQELNPFWSNRPYEVIRDVSREYGAYYFDSWLALKPHVQFSPRSKYYYNSDMHFNPRGYGLWAESHFRAICDLSELPPPPENE